MPRPSSRKQTGYLVIVLDLGRGGGVIIYGLALVISPLTTRPFRDGAPFLLLIETPPT